MSRIKRGRPSPAILVAVIALVAALGGTALAGPGPTANTAGKADKALKKAKKALKIAKAADKEQGPQGEKGDTGATGSKGDTGSTPACQGNDATDEMVSAGSVCIDRYEASVWSSPTGGTQYGVSSDDYPCDNNGQDCTGANAIYARSVAGVSPSTRITYFQAQQALANSGKRLPSNAEWQQAVAGTPDSTSCNVSSAAVAATGANAACISNHGANDMVGNLWEWVGDWVPASNATPGWGTFSDDGMGLSGASTTATGPGALVRGGDFDDGAAAGPFAVAASVHPSTAVSLNFGFRGAR